MRARVWICAVAAVLACAGAYANDEPAVSVRTRPDVTRVGAPFNIIVQTRGTPVRNFSLPVVDHLKIDPTVNTVTRPFSNEDGRNVVVTETRFVAVATAPGMITIPPIHVEVAGQRLATEAIEIEVLPQDTPPGEDSPNARERAIPIEEAFFIRTEVDKAEVYQGEAILISLALWRVEGVTAHTRRGAAVGPPDTTGFYTVDLPPAMEKRRRLVEGVMTSYDVHQPRRLLFPTATGELTIGAWSIEGEILLPDTSRALSPAGRRHPMPLQADPVTITVKPLPPGPAGFNGAVGQFRLDTRLSSQSTYLGQPIQLIAEVIGTGNPDAINAPRLAAIPGMHASPPRASTNIDKDERGIRVAKQFEYTLTPNQVGDFTIPRVSFVYFDPNTDEYATLEGREYPVRVGRPASPTARTFVAADDSEALRFTSLAEDIAPPASPPETLTRQSGYGTAALAAGYALPVLGYAGLAAFLIRRRRFERDSALARSHAARHRMDQRLRGIAQAPEPAVELYRALCGYVADRLNAPEAGMTPEDLQELCARHGLPATAYEGVEKTMRACERVRYSGGRLSVTEVEALLEATEVHIAQFDAALKEARAV